MDQLLVELGFFDSREKARTAIMTNKVHIAGKLENKAGKQINLNKFFENYETDKKYLSVVEDDCPYVSRGALKLKAAYEKFDLDFNDAVFLDLGASTGGFTDFVLEQGAKAVIALDVGKAQLADKLRQHRQVLSLEGENFRKTDISDLANKFQEYFSQSMSLDFVVADLSFVSITLMLDKIKELRAAQAKKIKCIFLIKPQFEAGKKEVDKCKGVIKDEKLRARIISETIEKITAEGFSLLAQTQSAIRGAKGNLEELVMFEI